MRNNIFIIALILLVSCTPDPEPKVTTTDDTDTEIAFPSDFVQDTIAIHNVFNEESFENDTMLSLLEELKICDPDVTKPFNIKKPPCEPRFYKFFKYNKNLAWKDGFALEIRAGIDDFPLRRLIVFKRIDGKLVKLNGFAANLAEMHTTPTGFNDLMLLFRDTEAGSFVVKYVWKKDVYQFKSLEAVDGYLVKPALQDSISRVVKKRLEKNHMFF
ncbi:MAG: hypothetical protein ABI207_02745 [Crocinitomicaceae bacterium]